MRALLRHRQGRPSLPPGRYFRMHLVGYFEGIDSERGLEWRCADSLSLREFLRLGTTEPVPDHSWLSRTRSRLPLEVHEAVFTWVLQRLAEHGLIKGDRIGVDASTIEANAALRSIVRRDTGEDYRDGRDRDADGHQQREDEPAGEHPPLHDACAGTGSGRTRTVSATRMISSTGRPAAAAWARIASGLEAW